MSRTDETSSLIIRSGATEWNDVGRLQGATDLPLSDSGREAISSLAESLPEDAVAVVLTAPDEASVATGEILARRTGAKVKALDDLREIDFGLWEGLPEDTLLERYAKSYKQWQDDPGSVTPPDGESIEHLEARLFRSIRRAIEKGPRRPVAVVLRPHCNALMRCRLQGRPLSEFRSLLEDSELVEEHTLTPGDLDRPATVARATS